MKRAVSSRPTWGSAAPIVAGSAPFGRPAARAFTALLLACQAPAPPPDVPASWPRPELPTDLEQQARDALVRDAWQRDDRFREALDPGRALRQTRISPADAERWPAWALYALGGALFEHSFTPAEGHGGADTPGLRRFHVGPRGGPDALRCADCHWRGGPAGAGDAADNAYLDGDGDTQASALERNPRSLLGAGVIERLAAEMTAELHSTRDALLRAARQAGAPLEAPLTAKGLSFGVLGALPDGGLDTRRVREVGPDLVVRPFGWKGRHARLLDVIEEQAALHLGLQTARFTAQGPERAGPHGGADPDGDGVVDELTDSQLLGLTLYAAMQETGHRELPTMPDHLTRWAAGEARFEALGCADCHVPSLVLDDPKLTVTTPSGLSRTVDLEHEGGEPRLQRSAEDGQLRVWLFSDLRRHSMGSRLSDTRPQDGIEADFWVTPPLWGLVRSGPYLHDGRAPSVEEAILAHDGEGLAAREAYAALSVEERYDVRLYLASLTRAVRLVAR
jgi:hypothetical protein